MLISVVAIAAMQSPPVSAPNKANGEKTQAVKPQPKSQPKLSVADETIPDSLLNPRWKVKKNSSASY
jgi:hypothetical protein